MPVRESFGKLDFGFLYCVCVCVCMCVCVCVCFQLLILSCEDCRLLLRQSCPRVLGSSVGAGTPPPKPCYGAAYVQLRAGALPLVAEVCLGFGEGASVCRPLRPIWCLISILVHL